MGRANLPAGSTHPTIPSRKCKDEPEHIQRAEDLLVTSGKPLRQENIKIGPPIGGIPSGDGGQGALQAVERKHEDLTEHDAGKDQRPIEAPEPGAYRHRDDGGDEKTPGDGVDSLDRVQAGRRPG